MDRANTQSSGSERPLARKLIVDISIMTVIGVVLALIGPLGSFADPLAIRLIMWVGLCYAGYLIYSPVGWVVTRMSATLDLPSAWLWVAGTMMATVPMTVVVWSLGQIGREEFLVPNAQDALLQYAYVLVIGGGITLLFNIIQRPQDRPFSSGSDPAAETQIAPSTNQLIEHLPAELGGEIIALEMEDHYVRVHTALGNELVLMRMRDAVAALGGFDGLQVHRSWWVARGAVEDVLRDGRNVRLRLDTGLVAPVSRANVQLLKDAGWI